MLWTRPHACSLRAVSSESPKAYPRRGLPGRKTVEGTSSRDHIRRGRWGCTTAIIKSGGYGGLCFGMGTERRNGPNSRWAHQGVRRVIDFETCRSLQSWWSARRNWWN